MSDATVAIIPARYESSRFPGKPLASETGRPLIQHVYEQAAAAGSVSRVLVATDDHRIAEAVRSFGGEAVMTRADHPNGTTRVAEVAATLDASFIVNVQGDEPEIDPDHIDQAARAIRDARDDSIGISTLAAPFTDHEDPRDPNIVKVVLDQRGRALYFSRAAIPFDRDGQDVAPPLKHVGLYVYRRAFLLDYVSAPPTPLERSEQLEQLRVLERGGAIIVVRIAKATHGIDTPDQYRAFVERWRRDAESRGIQFRD